MSPRTSKEADEAAALGERRALNQYSPAGRDSYIMQARASGCMERLYKTQRVFS